MVLYINTHKDKEYLYTVLKEAPAQEGDAELKEALSNIPKGDPCYSDGVINTLKKRYDLHQIYKVYHQMYG